MKSKASITRAPVLLICAALMLSAAMANAQTRLDSLYIKNLFDSAVEHYRQSEYEDALAILKQLSAIRWHHSLKGEVQLMLGKTYYKSGMYEKAVDIQKRLLRDNPDDSMVDFARYNLGESYYRLGEYALAARELLIVAINSENSTLASRGLTLAGHILENKATIEDIRRLRYGTLSVIERAFLTLKLSQRLYARGATTQAKKEAGDFLSAHENPPFKEELERVRDGKYSAASNFYKVGIVLPLSGTYGESGMRIMRGIDCAYRRLPEDVRNRIKISVVDNEADQVKTINAVRNFAADPSVIAVIGPMLSENAASASAVANSENLPVISPTATKTGIASLGPYSFQANVDLSTRGETAASYAVEQLNLSRFAILSPADDYGKQMTDSFAATVDRLGGEIVAEMWYYGNPDNLRPQFRVIRKVGWKILEQITPVVEPPDSAEILADTTLSDSLKLVRLEALSAEPEEIDSSKVVLDVIDGIYLPIQTGDIKFVAPQFAYWNLATQLLGGQNWYDIAQLEERVDAGYVDGIIFTSDVYYSGDNAEYDRLSEWYLREYAEEPFRTDIFGYDCMNLVVSTISKGALTREIFAENLAAVSDFRGVAGKIDFTGTRKRVNSSLHLIRYSNHQAVKLEF